MHPFGLQMWANNMKRLKQCFSRELKQPQPGQKRMTEYLEKKEETIERL